MDISKLESSGAIPQPA
jgi:hypothetical protein